MPRHTFFIAICTLALALALMLALALALAPVYAQRAPAGASSSMDMRQGMGANANSPLVQEIRLATAKYKDIDVALHEETGWLVATPCVSGPILAPWASIG